MKNIFFSQTPVQYFSNTQIDAVKGILILSVILGHLRPLVGENFAIFQFVYNYHVIGFLILPFLYPTKPVTFSQMKIWAARFFVPFTAFFIFYGALNHFVLGHDFGMSDAVKGYFIATPQMVDAVTGSEILWFLPHIFAVFVLFNLVVSKVKSLPLLLCGAFGAHIFMGFISKDVVMSVPFTALNILYLFFIGCAVRLMILMLKDKGFKYAWLFFTLFVISQFISILTSSVLGYTGIYLFDALSPFKLLLCDVVVISGVLFFLYCAVFEKIKPLTWLGRHSLIIFLVHQPFLFVCWKILERMNGVGTNVSDFIIYGGVSLIVALIGSVICVWFFMKCPWLNNIVFPRSWDTWLKR